MKNIFMRDNELQSVRGENADKPAKENLGSMKVLA
jgi:hypothetical protein